MRRDLPEKIKSRLPPAVRMGPEDTADDDKRSQWATDRWVEQDGVYRLRDRDIEENVRMIAGQQWWVYHHLVGWQDISYWMSDDEKRWRQRPTFNRILPWFISTMAKMTENQFICTFLPGPDHHDSELAEMLDGLYKLKWRDVGMTDAWSRCAAWLVSSGCGFMQSRVDLTKGEFESWEGQAELALMRGDGSAILGSDGQPIKRQVPRGVPFNAKGEPQAILRGESDQDEGQLEKTGEPHRARRGELVVDVFSPLEVRGQWGPIPWHLQSRHMTRSYLTPEKVYETYGVDVEPDVTDLPSSSAGFLERLLFGSGFWGAASSPVSPEVTGNTAATQADGYVCVQSTWMAPSDLVPGMEETPDSPGGRLLVTTQKKVLFDGPRPVRAKWTSTIRNFGFIRIPGRPWDSTPLEMMKSPQKAYNNGWRQVLENRALAANPQQLYDLESGLESEQIDNRPGRQYGVHMRPGIESPIKWIVPPPMSADVWRSQSQLASELGYLGSQSGMEQTANLGKKASGALVQELRFNDDRFLGPTMRRNAEEMGRLVEDWRAIFPVIYSAETILRFTGDDGAARTLLLMPELLATGDVSVIPDTESMLPEGRGERRTRIWQMWQAGAWGDPQSEEARSMLMDMGRFPNMAQSAAPGGADRAMARQEHLQMMSGVMPEPFEWQNHKVHYREHRQFMAAPEFYKLPDPVKAMFVQHLQATEIAMVAAAQKAAMMAMMSQPQPAQPAQGEQPPRRSLTKREGPAGGKQGQGAQGAAA